MHLRKKSVCKAAITSVLSLGFLAQILLPSPGIRPAKQLMAKERTQLSRQEGQNFEAVDPSHIDEAALEILRSRNLVKNPGFEETEAVSGNNFQGDLQPKDWTNSWRPVGKGTDYSFQVIDDGSGSNHILEMASQDADTPVRLFIGQDIEIPDPSVELVLSYELKTEELNGETGAFARLTWYSDPVQRSADFKLAKPDNMIQSDYISETNGWQRVTKVISVPEEAQGLRFQLANNNRSEGTTGTVWFDDAIIAPVTEYTEPVQPEDPEEPDTGETEIDLSGAPSEISPESNLLKNPGFELGKSAEPPFTGEQMPDLWTNTWVPVGAESDYLFDLIDDGSGSNNILRMASQDEETPVRLFLGQDVEILNPGTEHVLRFGLKTVDVLGVGPRARVTVFDQENQVLMKVQTDTTKGTTDWKEIVFPVDIPETAAYARIQLISDDSGRGATGQSYFDSIYFGAPYIDLTGASETITENNLVLNPGFEETVPGAIEDGYTGPAPALWSKTWIPKGQDTDYALQVIDDGSGNKILEIKSDGDKPLRAAIDQDFALPDSETDYQFRFDMKTQEITGGSGTRGRVTWFDENGQQISYLESSSKRGTSDWETYTIDIPASDVPAECKAARVILFTDTSGNGTTGAVYFDSIYFGPPVEEEEEPAEETFIIDQTPEEDMILATNKIHVPHMRNHKYTVEDESVARNDRGFIVPLAPGSTKVYVTNEDNEEVHSFELTVQKHDENNFDRMREHWAYIQAGNAAYDPTEAQMRENFERFEQNVANYMATADMDPARTYIWEDYPFEGVPDRAYSVSIRYGFLRLEEMAKAISNPHSAYYMDIEAIRFIKDNLRWLCEQHYHRGLPVTGNWWNYEIGATRHINNLLCFIYPFFTDEEVDQLTDAINYYVPDPGYSQATIQGPRVNRIYGANQVDIGKVKLITGVLREDSAQMKEASEAIADVLPLVTSGNGFYPDGSYLDHGGKNNKPVAYNGAYGLVLIEGLSKVVPIIQMSDNPWDESDLDIVYFWFRDAYFPLMYKGEFMDMTRGRSKSRVKEQPHDKQVKVFRPGLRIANMGDGNDPRQIAMKEIIKSQVAEDSYFDILKNLKGYSDFRAMKDLLEDDTIQGVSRDSYIKLYNSMDKFVYFNAERDFAVGISMYSDETQNYEDMNDENRQGWYEGDGMFYLYNGDLGHYSGDYRPTVDPYSFPGTTVLLEPRADGSGETNLPSAFVGMTKIAQDQAAVAMDFTNWNEKLTAKKAWFVFGDKIVFLGGEITGPEGQAIRTTIENRKVSDVAYDLYVNGAAYPLTKGSGESTIAQAETIFLEGPERKLNIGYAFLEDTDLKIKYENRVSSWSTINYGQSDAPVNEDYITVSQAHDAEKQSYAYVLYPNHSRDEFRQRAENQTLEVLRNDASVQAVYDAETKAWGIVKYDAEDFVLNEDVSLHSAGIYTIKEKDDASFEISYVDPAGHQDIGEANLTLSDDYEASFVPSKGLKDITSQASLRYVGETEEPTEPTETTEPTESEEPTEPTDPEEPTEPSETTEPTEPSEPVTPTTPSASIEDLTWLDERIEDSDRPIEEPTGITWLKGSAEGLVFKANGEIEDLLSIKLNGEIIFRAGEPLESDAYRLEEGSTILTLLPAALEKLPLGENTLELKFKRGDDVEAGVLKLRFTVKASAATSQDSDTTETKPAESSKPTEKDAPGKTGENNRMYIAGSAFLLSALLLAVIVLKRRRREDEQ